MDKSPREDAPSSSSRPRSSPRFDRGSFRGFSRGRSRGGYLGSRGRGWPPTRRGFRGGRGGYDSRGRGRGRGGGERFSYSSRYSSRGDRFGSSSYRDSFDRYPPKEYPSLRTSRDYRPRSLTPPPLDRDRGMMYYDHRDSGPPSRGYEYDRYGPGPDYRSPPGGRDYPPRDYPPRAGIRDYSSSRGSRDYPPPSRGGGGRDYPPSSNHRYQPDSRDMESRRDYGMRYDSPHPRSAPRRDYDPMPHVRTYGGGGPRGYDSYASGAPSSRDYESVRGPPMSSRPSSDGYVSRGPVRGPPGGGRDERSRGDFSMKRPMMMRDDSPPMKRMKGGPPPPRSAPRGGPQRF